jgi:hypothetical protein
MKKISKIKENIKQNTFLKKIKEYWSNKRYRGLFILGLWFFFFLFVILILRSTARYTPVVTKKTIPQILESIDNYNFSYEITADENNYKILGSYIPNQTVFEYDNQTYLISDNTYIVKDELLEETVNPLEIDLSKLNIQNIYNLIKDKESLYENEKDEIKTTVYKVGMNEFNQMMNKEIESSDYIEININTKSNNYESINIDLTKYMNQEELRYRNYNINISLSSLNQVNHDSYNKLLEQKNTLEKEE